MGALQLTDKQADFVRFVTSGDCSFDEAAMRAGYANGDAGHRLVRNPQIAAAIHMAIQSNIVAVAAPEGYRIALTLLRNEKVSERVRADISFKFMNMAGHIAPTSRDQAPSKQPSEMTRDELVAYIERNEAEILKIEEELAARAIDVSAPVAHQSGMVLDAKSLDYLD